MDINFSTQNLIVSNFERNAGGKFINMVLALHPDILLQDEGLAKRKMNGVEDIESSYKDASRTFTEKSQTGQHKEYGCTELAGFNGFDLQRDTQADEKRCNGFWIDLTNQERFYFFMVDHGEGTIFHRYGNRKTIRLKNYEWIVQARGVSSENRSRQVHLENVIHVDMSSIKDQVAFNKEIRSVFDFIGVSQPNEQQVFDHFLEKLRKGFLETLKIGFNKGETNDRRTR